MPSIFHYFHDCQSLKLRRGSFESFFRHHYFFNLRTIESCLAIKLGRYESSLLDIDRGKKFYWSKSKRKTTRKYTTTALLYPSDCDRF